MKKNARFFCVLVFFVFLIWQSAATIYTPKQDYAYYENRTLANFPAYTTESFWNGAYFAEIEPYLQDHIAHRTEAFRLDTWMKIHLLQQKVVNEVVVGENVLLPYLDFETVSEEEIQKQAQIMAQQIADVAAVTQEVGGVYGYVAVPCQYACHEQDYPSYLNNRADRTLLTRTYFFDYLTENKVPFIDMGEILSERGCLQSTSSAIDNHYSLQGAYLTYQSIAEHLFPLQMPKEVVFTDLENPYLGSRERKLFDLWNNDEKLQTASFEQEIPFTRMDSGNIVPSTVYAFPETTTEDVLYSFYMGGDQAETILSTNRPELPKVLIYGDSFTNALECLFYYSCDELRTLDLRYYKDKSLVDYIKEYQPDFVICVRDYESLLSLDGNGKIK